MRIRFLLPLVLPLLLSPAAPSTGELSATCSVDPATGAKQCCKVCRTGKACGNSCIAAWKTCRRGGGCACDAGGGGASSSSAARSRPARVVPSENVREVQVMLRDLGYEVGTPDGIAGPGTRAAVRAFQRDQNMEPDGIAGPATQDRLRAAVSRRRAEAARPPVASEHGTMAGTCTVSRVYDGDTVTCRDGTKIRLLLIDAPEMGQAESGREARTALLRILPLGTTARVELDVEKQDRYERTLAYLHLPDGRMVNEELARSGYALVLSYPPNVKHIDRIRTAVESAKTARRGLWATSAFKCSPRDYRAKRCE